MCDLRDFDFVMFEKNLNVEISFEHQIALDPINWRFLSNIKYLNTLIGITLR